MCTLSYAGILIRYLHSGRCVLLMMDVVVSWICWAEGMHLTKNIEPDVVIPFIP